MGKTKRQKTIEDSFASCSDSAVGVRKSRRGRSRKRNRDARRKEEEEEEEKQTSQSGNNTIVAMEETSLSGLQQESNGKGKEESSDDEEMGREEEEEHGDDQHELEMLLLESRKNQFESILKTIVREKESKQLIANIDMPAISLVDDDGESVDEFDMETPEGIARVIESAADYMMRVETAKAMGMLVKDYQARRSKAKDVDKYIPTLGPEDVRPFLREPVGDETSCVAGSECYVRYVRDWPGDRVLRSLQVPLPEDRMSLDGKVPNDHNDGLCILCHDFLVFKFFIEQEHQMHQGIGFHGTVNRVNYRFGPNGYKPSLVAMTSDGYPIPNVVGQVFVTKTEHFSAYEQNGLWRVSDEPRHF